MSAVMCVAWGWMLCNIMLHTRRVDWHVTSFLAEAQWAPLNRSFRLVYINIVVFNRANMFVAVNCQRPAASHRTGVVGKSLRSSETAKLCQQPLDTMRLHHDENRAHGRVSTAILPFIFDWHMLRHQLLNSNNNNKIRISRHTVSCSHCLTFGLLNVQSANNKIDDILDMKKEQRLDIMLLTETWHDTD